MFTGLVEEVATVTRVKPADGNLRVEIAARTVLEDMRVGDSVAVSGCCLTVVAFDETGFEVELSQETLDRTAPRWREGVRVNLERAMKATSRFGGHIVSGHVEGVGRVLEVRADPGAYVVAVRAAPPLARYLIPKGSITVDGVSLTLVDVGGPGGSRPDLPPEVFNLWLIPHTLHVTTLGELGAGDRVNLEADPVAKWVERLTLLQGAHPSRVEENHVPQTS